ncbi:hypothetical protein LJC59_01330 [Desulfovibrio sp. OttesenSCG-928-A18]|nr:hypothetical protein [Desulfovibrio sp. OttesenSCG-928-A18]
MTWSTVEQMSASLGVMDERDFALAGRAWNPGLGEYIGAAAGQAFDKSSGARIAESLSIWKGESDAKDAGTLEVYQDEEEYKASAFYREGVKFQPGMSNVRARIIADGYDERRRRERILDAGDRNGPWVYGVAGFGAGLIGSLPDPVNLIPFGGGMASGARLAGMTARQVLVRGVKVGAVEGAAGNLLSSSFAAWDLNRKGEDITAQHVFLDTMFGAAAGPVFRGAGAFIGRARARKSARADMGYVLDALPEDSPSRAWFKDTLESMRQGNANAYVEAARIVKPGEGHFIDVLRRNSNPEERLEIARAMEKAVSDMVNGDPVDASAVNVSQAIGKAYDRVLADPMGGPPDEVLAVLSSPEFERLLLLRGPSFLTSKGELRFSGEYIQKAFGFSRKGAGMVKIIWKHGEKSTEPTHLRVTREDVMRLPVIIRDYEPSISKGRRVWVVGAGDGTGAKLKVVAGKQKGSAGNVIVSMYRLEGAAPLSGQRKAPASPGPQTPLKDTSVAGDTTAAPFRSSSAGAGAEALERASATGRTQADSIIIEDRNAVNQVDWRTEPQPDAPLPERSALEAADSESATIAAADEIRAAELVSEGRASETDLAELEKIDADKSRIDSIEDASLSIADCVMRVP